MQLNDFEGMPSSDASELEEATDAIEPLSENQLCMKAIQEVLQSLTTNVSDSEEESKEDRLASVLDAKILDFGAGRGQLGQLLTENGFNNVFGQEGSEAKKQFLLRKGYYADIVSYIVGKQGLPSAYRRSFDVVTCAGGLGTNLLPARCFDDMLNALRPGGFIIFTVS